MVIGSLPANANEEGVRRVLDWVCLDCYCRADSDSPVQETMPLLSSETQVPSIRNVRIESSEYTVDLPTFLIQRACANSALVNYFYWWLVYFHPSTYPPPFYFDPSHRFICLGFFLLSLHTAWLIYLCKCSLGGGLFISSAGSQLSPSSQKILKLDPASIISLRCRQLPAGALYIHRSGTSSAGSLRFISMNHAWGSLIPEQDEDGGSNFLF